MTSFALKVWSFVTALADIRWTARPSRLVNRHRPRTGCTATDIRHAVFSLFAGGVRLHLDYTGSDCDFRLTSLQTVRGAYGYSCIGGLYGCIEASDSLQSAKIFYGKPIDLQPVPLLLYGHIGACYSIDICMDICNWKRMLTRS